MSLGLFYSMRERSFWDPETKDEVRDRSFLQLQGGFMLQNFPLVFIINANKKISSSFFSEKSFCS